MYVKLPILIEVPVRIALWVILLLVFALNISSSPESLESLSFVIFFMLFVMGGPVKFSKINPLSFIAAIILCAIIVFGITAFLTAENEREKEKENNSFYETCSICDGEGIVDTNCECCGGSGNVRLNCANCGGNGRTDSEDLCYDCVGRGYTALTCEECGGSGNASYRSECHACKGTGRRLKDKYR